MTGTGTRIRHGLAIASMLAAAAGFSALLVAGGASAQAGNCLGSPATIGGTTGDDVIAGTPGNDVINAQGGNDAVNGGAGDDLICAGAGFDNVIGGQGNDRIEGSTEDDYLVGDVVAADQEVGSGDDEIAGGDGADVVIGDELNNTGVAGGQGNDALNGGEANDLVVGDAFSNVLAIGIGADDIQGGPGTDITIGDAMVGMPFAAAEGPVAPVNGDGGAFGAGADTLRTQTEDDLLVGDAVSFVRDEFGPVDPEARDSARQDLGLIFNPASAYCGTGIVRAILRRQEAGWDEQRLIDFARDVLKSEFGDDMLIGDCASALGFSSGAGPDSLNGGTENDVSVGGGAGAGASGSKADKDSALGGKGNDYLTGDEAFIDLVNAAADSLGLDLYAENVGGKLIVISEKRESLPPGEVHWNPFVGYYAIDVTAAVNGTPQRRGAQEAINGGGSDDLSGGQGNDGLEGGPKRDKCSGGPGKDVFVKKGPFKCEEITGDP